jgi:FkbM family methyltransferase
MLLSLKRLEKSLRKKTTKRLQRRFFSLLAERRPDTFVEVGAFNAAASLRVRELLPEARIVALEANPRNYEKYRQDVEGYGIEYLNMAAASHCGSVSFHMLSEGDGANPRSSLLKRSDDKHLSEPIEVPCARLDSLIDGARRAALWIDVEGAARDVLAGAEATLRCADLILIEVEEHRHWKDQWLKADVVNHLAGFGFSVIGRDIEGPDQHNVLMSRNLKSTG